MFEIRQFESEAGGPALGSNTHLPAVRHHLHTTVVCGLHSQAHLAGGAKLIGHDDAEVVLVVRTVLLNSHSPEIGELCVNLNFQASGTDLHTAVQLEVH